MASRPYLTKSRYLAGNQCLKRLWQQCHDRLPEEEVKASASMVAGQEVGLVAHRLFPGGVLVEASPQELRQAAARTAELIADRAVPAIFEATLIAGRLLVRVDILERLPRGRWGLREVKSSTSVKDEHLDDVAFQLHVAREAGLKVASVEVIHVNNQYVLGPRGLAPERYFSRVDVKAEAEARLPEIARQAKAYVKVTDQPERPQVEPWTHCSAPYECEFMARCTAGYPADWVLNLPRHTARQLEEFRARGIQSIGKIPDDVALNGTQTTIRDAHRSGKPFISPGLGAALKDFGPPAWFLDFETVSPAIPLYAGTRPYQPLPFQWSLHHLDLRGKLTHRDFLAEGHSDPREAFTTSLIDALAATSGPIMVYSSYERTMLKNMAAHFPKLARSLNAIIERFCDLLKVVNQHYYHPGFNGSFSIKAVGPVLAKSVDYESLEGVADGEAASSAFARIASGGLSAEEAGILRQQLLRYCRLDTLAMVEVMQALARFDGGDVRKTR